MHSQHEPWWYRRTEEREREFDYHPERERFMLWLLAHEYNRASLVVQDYIHTLGYTYARTDSRTDRHAFGASFACSLADNRKNQTIPARIIGCVIQREFLRVRSCVWNLYWLVLRGPIRLESIPRQNKQHLRIIFGVVDLNNDYAGNTIFHFYFTRTIVYLWF